jgi:alpha-L-fucosidase
MPDGRIEPLQIERLKEMGKWLEKYGYTLYETRGGPFKPTDWGVSTRKGNTIYLHILKWTGNSPKITIPDLGVEIKRCSLTSGAKVKVTKLEKNTVIEFSSKDLQPINTILEVELAGSAMELKPMEISSNSLSFSKPLTASSNPKGHWSNHQWVDMSAVTNGDWSGAFWEPEANDKNPWLEIDLGKAQKFSKAYLYERGTAVKSFELQYLKGESWKTAYKGATIGSKAELKLSGFSAQKVRLVLKDFSGVPGIYEIILM